MSTIEFYVNISLIIKEGYDGHVIASEILEEGPMSKEASIERMNELKQRYDLKRFSVYRSVLINEDDGNSYRMPCIDIDETPFL